MYDRSRWKSLDAGRLSLSNHTLQIMMGSGVSLCRQFGLPNDKTHRQTIA